MDEEPAVSRFPATFVRERPGGWVAMAALGILAIALIAFAVMTLNTYGMMFAALAAGGVARLYDRRNVGTDGHLEVAGGALRFGGQRLVGLEDIESALAIPRKGGKAIVLIRPRAAVPLRFDVASLARARAVLAATGQSLRQRPPTFTLPTLHQGLRALVFTLASGALLASLVAAMLRGDSELALWAIPGAIAYVAFLRASTAKLEIRAEGLRLTSFGRERLVPHAEIVRAEPFRRSYTGVELAPRSGEILRIPTSSSPESDGGLGAGIAELIRSSWDSSREVFPEEEARLACAGRSGKDWLRALRRLASGAELDPRTSPLDPTRAWKILEDPSSEAAARAGAATFLAQAAGAEDREKIRILAHGIEAPKLRVAIEAIVDHPDDEDAVIEALESVRRRRTDVALILTAASTSRSWQRNGTTPATSWRARSARRRESCCSRARVT